MTDHETRDLLRQEKEEKFEAMLDSIRWSPTGKAALLDLILETWDVGITDAIREGLSGPLREEGENLIAEQKRIHTWKGLYHG